MIIKSLLEMTLSSFQIHFFGLSGYNTIHLYIMSEIWHWLFRGHSDFTPQLHGFSSLTSLLITFLLWDICCAQHDLCARIANLYTVFLLRIAWSLLDWKVLLETFLLKGGLNLMMLRERKFFDMSKSAYEKALRQFGYKNP